MHPGQRVWVTSDPTVAREAERAVQAAAPEGRVPLRLVVSGRVGEPLRVEATARRGATVAAWRRLGREVDEPVETLRLAAARLAAGEPGGPLGAAATGSLAPLAAALDKAGRAVTLRTDRLSRKAEWGEATGMIIEALEFAQDESEAFVVASKALALEGVFAE